MADRMPANTKRMIARVIPWLVVGLVGWFFYHTLVSNWDNIQHIDLSPDILAVSGVAFFVSAVVISGILWGRMLSLLSGTKIRTKDAIRIHAASWLLKYIPGQVGSYVNKIAWGSKNGIAKKTISTSFIYENVLMVFASVVLSIPVVLLFRSQLNDDLLIILCTVALIPMGIVLFRPVFYKLLNTATSLLKRKPFKNSDFLRSKDIVLYQLGYLLPRLANGVGFVLIAASVFAVDPSTYIGLGAAYILASIIGLLAIFVPGGVGVREAVLVAVLSVYFPVEQAIILSLVARLYATIADVGVAGVYLMLNRGRLRQ